MGQKRFCDGCGKSIIDNEKYIELSIIVKFDPNNGIASPNYKGDNCLECARVGKGLIDIMKLYDEGLGVSK